MTDERQERQALRRSMARQLLELLFGYFDERALVEFRAFPADRSQSTTVLRSWYPPGRFDELVERPSAPAARTSATSV
ncbi:MAG: hypothetical protein M5U09_13670 [Gammaproteobacteria bacterium]|nr:hypothetical protein [Gammaproteobacteria bacterium]